MVGITIVSIAGQPSKLLKKDAGTMRGIEEQAAAGNEAAGTTQLGKKRHLVVGMVAKNRWGLTRDLVTTFTKTS